MSRRAISLFILITLLQLLCYIGFCHGRLRDSDLAALKEIRNGLYDLPGSVFFQSWDFESSDPCNLFSGVMCRQIDGFFRVETLNLGSWLASSPGLKGELSPSLGNLTALRQLIVFPGRVTGQIPDTLGNLHKLEFLGISQNCLSGPIPWSFKKLQCLRTLDLSYNQLQGSIPAGLTHNPNLKILVLGHNNIMGKIPSIECQLLHMDLSHNMLSGDLPLLPSSLQYLSLTQNVLSGSLENLSSLNRLKHLDLSLNQFIGSIPASLFGVHQLSNVFLQRNRLSGNLGIQAGSVTSIDTIDLSHNNLSGELSPILANARNIYLNHNHLTGMVPLEYVRKIYTGRIRTFYIQHNYFSAFPLAAGSPLPISGSLCIRYNCMDPPVKSPCPMSSGGREKRPTYECKNF